MVKLMHEMQPDQFKIALKTQDILQRTPLHRAALFDHVAVVEYLIHMVSINMYLICRFLCLIINCDQ